jgi:hypothetical protein
MSPSGHFRICILLSTSILLTNCASKKKEGLQDLYIPEVVTFAGDTVPIQDPEIRERLEKELWINVYWQSNTVQWIKKSGRWFPMIDSLLKQNQVPGDFKFLVPIESSFENVSSHKGAVGFWQLMEPTAKEFGLIINEEMDQRLDPRLATQAACKLINRGKKVLGNWTSVAASYNIGITGLKNVMESQYTDSFYDLLINPETGRYFFRALAAKLILSEPEKYGFDFLKKYEPYPVETKKVDSSILDLPHWCRRQGVSYKCFRMVNPWIKSSRISVSDSIPFFELDIPKNCRLYTSLPLPDSRPPLTDSVAVTRQSIFQNLVNNKDMLAHKEIHSKKDQTIFHEVKAGENISLIAQKYKMELKMLFELNPGLEKKQNKIHKGMKIKVKP